MLLWVWLFHGLYRLPRWCINNHPRSCMLYLPPYCIRTSLLAEKLIVPAETIRGNNYGIQSYLYNYYSYFSSFEKACHSLMLLMQLI